MSEHAMQFDAVDEAQPGLKWAARWNRSGPAYLRWFCANGGEAGPGQRECERALARHMPELVPTYSRLLEIAGGGSTTARFLSTWCPPAYLGGCSIAAVASHKTAGLVRNYDLAPNLNEGLLLRSAWLGKPVMGMVEFLWGLSDGINDDGLCAALAFGGRSDTATGFGVTTIVRYVLETCRTVDEALTVFRRVPSHMAYNIVLADRQGATASVELQPGGGLREAYPAVATNHQHGVEMAERPEFTATLLRHAHLTQLVASESSIEAVADAFLRAPVHQTRYAQGFGTLFTAVYQPGEGGLILRWPSEEWTQFLHAFHEGTRIIRLARPFADQIQANAPASEDLSAVFASIRKYLPKDRVAAFDHWRRSAAEGRFDWPGFGALFS